MNFIRCEFKFIKIVKDNFATCLYIESYITRPYSNVVEVINSLLQGILIN